ncbi:MAG: cupin domain-containing protein [Candidatus Marinimicrobia bacterium]|nr:cupin domain-containing protein [Candidatus Neomarinimicrobiota bacterium]
MKEIKILHNPEEKLVREMGIRNWPVWEKEVSEFAWSYDEQETCLLLEGEVEVRPEGGEPVKFGKGDLVVFPAGMSCTWKISKAVKKHYNFG